MCALEFPESDRHVTRGWKGPVRILNAGLAEGRPFSNSVLKFELPNAAQNPAPVSVGIVETSMLGAARNLTAGGGGIQCEECSSPVLL